MIETIGYIWAFFVFCVLPQVAVAMYFDYMQYLDVEPAEPQPEPLPPPKEEFEPHQPEPGE